MEISTVQAAEPEEVKLWTGRSVENEKECEGELKIVLEPN